MLKSKMKKASDLQEINATDPMFKSITRELIDVDNPNSIVQRGRTTLLTGVNFEMILLKEAIFDSQISNDGKLLDNHISFIPSRLTSGIERLSPRPHETSIINVSIFYDLDLMQENDNIEVLRSLLEKISFPSSMQSAIDLGNDLLIIEVSEIFTSLPKADLLDLYDFFNDISEMSGIAILLLAEMPNSSTNLNKILGSFNLSTINCYKALSFKNDHLLDENRNPICKADCDMFDHDTYTGITYLAEK